MISLNVNMQIRRTHEGFGYEIDLDVACDYSPERPAPHCRNPSASAYSDSGDPAEMNIIEAKVTGCFCDDEGGPEWLRSGQLLPKGVGLTEGETTHLLEVLEAAYDAECESRYDADCESYYEDTQD